MAARDVPIAEAMRLTGLSAKALNARVRRGTVKASKVGGRWYFDVADLYERGLVAGASMGVTVAELLDRLEAQARRIGELEAELGRKT